MQTTPQPRASSSSSSTSAEIAVVEEFFAAFQALDLDRALELLADDVVYQNVPFPADRGKAAVTRTLRGFGKVMTGFEVQMKNIASNGRIVLTERVDVLKAPIADLELWVCGTFEVQGGRIVLWRDYFDVASAAAQVVTGPFRKLFGRKR
ncbi:MAG TPA: limonene-1,2-epoxide hydrolase family protein [Polyangiaceae bacterium]|jgi:limonene-1,2-epoxide hydrolase